jgi:hypothetical protein
MQPWLEKRPDRGAGYRGGLGAVDCALRTQKWHYVA